MNSQLPDGPAVAIMVASATLEIHTRHLASRFSEAGVETPELDARLLVCKACDLTHEQFIADPERALSQAEVVAIEDMARRRLGYEPVSRILGHREFHGLDFLLGADTLDPRPDTETLVEAAMEIAQTFTGNDISFLDLGTGSGCILVSLLHALPSARGVGVDVSEGALEIARSNAQAHGVEGRSDFVRSEWTAEISETFDLVVSNPPYIASREIEGLKPEVAGFDPRRALDGGDDGLDAYRQIVSQLGSVLSPGGWVLLEIGANQALDVSKIIEGSQDRLGLGEVRAWRDLSGQVRCVGAKRSPR